MWLWILCFLTRAVLVYLVQLIWWNWWKIYFAKLSSVKAFFRKNVSLFWLHLLYCDKYNNQVIKKMLFWLNYLIALLTCYHIISSLQLHYWLLLHYFPLLHNQFLQFPSVKNSEHKGAVQVWECILDPFRQPCWHLANQIH